MKPEFRKYCKIVYVIVLVYMSQMTHQLILRRGSRNLFKDIIPKVYIYNMCYIFLIIENPGDGSNLPCQCGILLE